MQANRTTTVSDMMNGEKLNRLLERFEPQSKLNIKPLTINLGDVPHV